MFRLAGHLGKTVGELEQSLSVSELAEWQAYDSLDPIGGFRLDANIAWLIRVLRGDKDSCVDDFLLFDPNPMTDEQREMFEMIKQKQRLQADVDNMLAMFNRS